MGKLERSDSNQFLPPSFFFSRHSSQPSFPASFHYFCFYPRFSDFVSLIIDLKAYIIVEYLNGPEFPAQLRKDRRGERR